MSNADTGDDTFAGRRATAPGAASDHVYASLRERIVSLDLPPGTPLGRAELAQTYGVSQTPIRDALQRLEQDGLVLIYPQSKTEVSRIDIRQLYETQFLRVAVETEVVRRLSMQKSDDVIRRAQAILKMQSALVDDEGAMEMFSSLDRDFHLTLFAGVGMESLHALLRRRLGHLYRCQRLELPRAGKMQSIVDAHRKILDGITAGDPDLAASAIRAHLSGTISQIDSLRAEYPAYFTADDPAQKPPPAA